MFFFWGRGGGVEKVEGGNGGRDFNALFHFYSYSLIVYLWIGFVVLCIFKNVDG